MDTIIKPCSKCGGLSQFYHLVDDENRGYVKCTVCGKKQKLVKRKDWAIADWNKANEDKNSKAKRIWDNYEIIGEVQKSTGIKFVIAAATREGFRYINIREFYFRKRDGVWKPGRDGITIPLVAGINKGESFIKPYKELMFTLADAAKFAATMELIDADKAIWIEPERKTADEN